MKSPYTPPSSNVTDVTPERSKPRQVRWAVKLLWIDLMLSVPAAFLSYQRGADQYDGAGAAIAVALTAALFALAAFVIVNLDRGFNWARIIQVVLVGLALLMMSVPGNDLAPPAPIETVLEYVTLALEIIALYLVFTRPGTSWYARRD